jgi:hypothetical protein
MKTDNPGARNLCDGSFPCVSSVWSVSSRGRRRKEIVQFRGSKPTKSRS